MVSKVIAIARESTRVDFLRLAVRRVSRAVAARLDLREFVVRLVDRRADQDVVFSVFVAGPGELAGMLANRVAIEVRREARLMREGR